MVKIEAKNLEDAYLQAAQALNCSVTEIDVVVIQQPKKKILGLLGKNAIIVANCKIKPEDAEHKTEDASSTDTSEDHLPEIQKTSEKPAPLPRAEKVISALVKEGVDKEDTKPENGLSIKTILPEFLTKKEDKTENSSRSVVGKVSQVIDNFFEDKQSSEEIALIIQKEINALFDQLCFSLNAIEVTVYDDSTLLVEFSGEDAALLIGKEGYRYKALSYMLFNWINSKYKMQLRLEIAEFLKNQEESIARYLMAVYENVDRDGNAQTKVLDGVLVQIALTMLRERYHNKYVAIRSTRDGGKYIIVNDYNSH